MAKKDRDKASKEEMPKAPLTLSNLKKSLRLFKYVTAHKWKFFLGLFFLAGTAYTALKFPQLMGSLMGVIAPTSKATNLDALLKVANDTGVSS